MDAPTIMTPKGLQPRGTAQAPQGVSKPLMDQLRTQLAENGTLSSSDIASLSQEEEAAQTPSGSPAAPTELPADSSTPDPLMRRASAQAGRPLAAAASPAASKRPLVITPEEKEAFIDALVHNKRFVLRFSFYGGRVRVVVRSRTVRESQAIVAAERADLDKKRIVTQLDYVVRLRAMLMVAQVEEFDDAGYSLMETPLLPTVESDGSVTPPGWYPRIDYWLGQNEAMLATVWQAVEEFEAKYWKMVEDAKDSNFWNPAASSSV